MAEHLPVCHTQLLETTLLTTWALRNRTSSKRTNIRKSAFPLLFISFQINILFYFSWEFAFEGLAGSSAISYTGQRQQRRVSSTVRGVYPKSWSSPSLAQEEAGRSIMGRKQDRMGPTPLIKPAQYGASAGTGNGFRKSEQSWHYGKNVHLRTFSVPAGVWVTVRMNSQEIIVHLGCNKVHQFIFCSQ